MGKNIIHYRHVDHKKMKEIEIKILKDENLNLKKELKDINERYLKIRKDLEA